MLKPSQISAFGALYAIAAGNGREEALFGDSFPLAQQAFEKSLIGSSYPHAYLEFPLIGKPCFDLLTVHGTVEEGARFAPGAGFGRQAMFDWFAANCKGNDTSCGLELDTSVGEVEEAGVYLQYRGHRELIAPFMEAIGESERTDAYLAVLERLPQGWDAAYIGLFPGRAGAPVRIGGYMGGSVIRACGQDPAFLGEQFRQIGFSAYTDEMLKRCSLFMSMAPGIDFQFDIMEDGSLGPTFGLSLSFNETMPRQAHECMTSGYGARIMETLQSWGIADDRWRLIADAAFARHVPFEREDGSEGRLALCVLFNYAKVKFTNGVAHPAKFYFNVQCDELTEA